MVLVLGRFCAGLGDLLAVNVILVGKLSQPVIIDPELVYFVLFAKGLGVCLPLGV